MGMTPSSQTGRRSSGRCRSGREPLKRALKPTDTTSALQKRPSERGTLVGRRGRERYRALVERAPVGVFEMDAEFHCVYVNERWSEITGVAREDAMGDGWSAGLHPDDEAALVSEFGRALDGSHDFRLEHRWVHPDGSVRWVLTLAHVVRDSGTVTGFAGTLTDITGEHYAEERLVALVAHSSDAIV